VLFKAERLLSSADFGVNAGKQGQPNTGGVILAKAETRAEIEDIILNDPFRREKIAEYEIIEFLPTTAATHLANLRAA
jgi:uncharacterized protein YciI